MQIQTDKRFLKVNDFAEIFDVNKQRAYEILRRNPEIVVKLGDRQIRVDATKLEEWVASGGSSKLRSED